MICGVVKVNALFGDGVDLNGISTHSRRINALAVGAIGAVSRPEDFGKLRGRQIFVDEISTRLALAQRFHNGKITCRFDRRQSNFVLRGVGSRRQKERSRQKRRG